MPKKYSFKAISIHVAVPVSQLTAASPPRRANGARTLEEGAIEGKQARPDHRPIAAAGRRHDSPGHGTVPGKRKREALSKGQDRGHESEERRAREGNPSRR